MKNQDDILTISEIASLLKVAGKTVYGLAKKGELPAFKVGGQWRFSRTALNSWIEAKTRAASTRAAKSGGKPSGSRGGNEAC
jgi:excisionase family DNA binding protein